MCHRLLPPALFAVVALSNAGCGDPGFDDVLATVSGNVPTVIAVSFETSLEDVQSAHVLFYPDGVQEQLAPAVQLDDGSYEALLVGNKARSEIVYRPVILCQDDTYSGRERTVTTGALPARLPQIWTTVDEASRSHTGYLVTSILNSPATVVILDADGDVVWWHEVGDMDDEDLTTNRAWLARDGRSVVYRLEDQYGPPMGLVRVGLDSIELDFRADGMAHHDFVELPDGTIATLRHDTREVDGGDVVGDQLVELTPDGDEIPLWTVWDHATLGQDDDPTDWTHANAVDYDPDRDTYWLGLRNIHTIFEIDRATGDVLRRLGGSDSDVTPPDGADSLWQYQHQFDMSGGAIRVFDNGAPEQLHSRAVAYQIDGATGQAEEIWSHHNDPPIYNPVLGDVRELPNGNMLVTWAVQGQIDEITPEGELVWRLNVALGGALGYTSWVPTLYP